ncbi:uncharacterized protein LOC132307726 [Cornus florida]|uniref:uncharacterized protein LOC132307726 n=1 Tax=Cornus florida TaxID=4283 RepID=UPI00289A0D53|nr:uncharacterized protein LOC132307726 [Cornus florida]
MLFLSLFLSTYTNLRREEILLPIFSFHIQNPTMPGNAMRKGVVFLALVMVALITHLVETLYTVFTFSVAIYVILKVNIEKLMLFVLGTAMRKGVLFLALVMVALKTQLAETLYNILIELLKTIWTFNAKCIGPFSFWVWKCVKVFFLAIGFVRVILEFMETLSTSFEFLKKTWTFIKGINANYHQGREESKY